MSACKVYTKQVKFKTYLTGKQDKHPIFLENRVYQGSSGAVYPYGVTDTLLDKFEDKLYNAIILENDYLEVMILPELGGRVHRAYDKVNKRDFVYFNQVVKPALVGLLGPWISGGIEFNWPQHHRPTTFMPVDFCLNDSKDDVVSCTVGEKEPMHGLVISTTFSLYADKALLEIKSRVYNANETPRSFLWWSNPAVKGGDQHQSVFPPDVTAVFDHGKRAVIDFPIAHGTYYKVDYDGVDISRYKNIPVPTSYMADKSDYDFVGAYCHDEQGGLLHVADHHVSPGKKQWSWGYGDFGQAWDRSLTDNDGPYIELMTGVYTDNQPDFTCIDSGEEKEFVQNFLPYAKLGTLQNANTTCALKLERADSKLVMGLYAIAKLDNVKFVVTEQNSSKVVYEKTISLTPCKAELFDCADTGFDRLNVSILDKDGNEILSYLEHIKQEVPLPQVAKAPALPCEITSTDEAYFIGQHLLQYHHASSNCYDYFLRGIELDKYDYRNNVAMGEYEYNRANYQKAKEYAQNALKRALMLNKNPQCGFGSILLANCQFKLNELKEAYDSYFRATWSNNTKTLGYVGLSRISLIEKSYVKALEFANRALETCAYSQDAMALKAYALVHINKDQALTYLDEVIKIYPLTSVFYYIQCLCCDCDENKRKLTMMLNGREINYISIAKFLLEIKQTKLCQDFFADNEPCGAIANLIYASLCEGAKRNELIAKAQAQFDDFVRFPNLVFERDVLASIEESPFALHLCASFDYAHRLYDSAVALWNKVLKLDANHVEALRGLGIHAFNKLKDNTLALNYFKQALEHSNGDERLIFEYDLLLSKTKASLDERLAILDKYNVKECVRDDLKTTMVTLLNAKGRIDEAHDMLNNCVFHVFEGGEGKITNQYIVNAILRALREHNNGDDNKALEIVLSALTYPHNLSEGRLIGQTDNDLYLFAAYFAKCLNNNDKVKEYLTLATIGDTSISEQHYYNDQPLDYVFYNAKALCCLGNNDKASAIFTAMNKWADNAIEQKTSKDFFAVSLPQLVVLDSDDDVQRQINCHLIKMLSAIGLKDKAAYDDAAAKLEALEPSNSKIFFYNKVFDVLVNIESAF